MSGVPYIRFFGDDWLSGTQELSLEERGALITIVALIASSGSMASDDYTRTARRFGVTPAKAKKLINILLDLGKIRIENGKIINDRAQKELKKSQEFSQKQSENARGNRSKKDKKTNKNNGGAEATAKPRLNQPEPEPDIKNNRSKGGKKTNVHNRVFEAWNSMAGEHGLSIVKTNVLNPNRSKAILSRLKDCGGDEQVLYSAISNVPNNPHWLGQNNRGWKANFDWVFKSTNFSKVLEHTQETIISQRDKNEQRNNKPFRSAAERRYDNENAGFQAAMAAYGDDGNVEDD